MGRWLATLLLAIVAAIAALLIVPSLIDWSGFRAPIEREASRLAGRPVTIKGDIGLHMLPSPGFALGDVTIADPRDKTAPLLRAKEIDASLAWLPLIVGRIELAQLALSEPLIRVQITKSGTTNWSGPNIAASPASRSRLKFRDIAVGGGTLLFFDDRNGAQSQANKISGHIGLPSEDGSLSIKLDFTIDAQPMRFALNLNQVVAGATSTFTAGLSFLNGGGAIASRGTATGVASALDRWRLEPIGFRSTFDLQSGSSTSVAHGIVALALFDTPHTPINDTRWARFRPLTLAMTGALDLTGDALSLTNANGSLGRTRFTASAARGRTANTLNLSASADILYLDEIIDFKTQSGLRFAPVGAVASPLSGLGLCHCEGEAKLSAPRVKFGTSELTDFLIDLKLHEAGTELAKAHITLPGESQLDASGSFSPTAGTDGAVFDGSIVFNSVGPRAFMAWLGLSTARLAPNALKTLSLVGPLKLIDRAPSAQSGLKGTSFEHYPVPLIDDALLSLDDQRLQLTASYDDRAPRNLLLHLSGDALDADAYGLSGFWLPAMPLAASGWGRTVWGRALHASEVDLKIQLGEMRLGGHPVHGFDATVNRSAAGASNAHIAIDSFSGYRVLFDEERSKSGGAPPDISAHLNISGAGKPIKLPFAGKGLPGSLKLDATLAQTGGAASYVLAGSSGDIAFKGTGAGPASGEIIPDIETLNLTAHMSQGDIAFSGSFGAVSTAPDLEGNLTIDALDFAAFLRELGYTYEPRRKDLGALSLVAQLSLTGEHISLTELAANIGQDNVSGRGTLSLGSRDKLNAELKISHATLADYLPLPEKGSIWSPDRMKLDVLRTFDGSLSLTADRVTIGPYDLNTLSASLTLQDGALETKAARASLYGGALNASGAIHISTGGFNGTLHGALDSFDWARAARKLFPAIGTSGTGKADARFALSASGRSMVDFVHSLEGDLDVRGYGGALMGFDLPAWSKGAQGVNGIESFLYLAKSSLTSGSTFVSNFSVTATANRGVIALGTSHIVLDGGQGTLSGEVALPSRSLSLRLSAQANAHPDIAPIGIIAVGPIAGPARYYDLNDAAKSISAQLGFSKSKIEPSDVARDLRDLLRAPPSE